MTLTDEQEAKPSAWPRKEGEYCNYPDCNCPFDAPADPNWCAKGWPHKPAITDEYECPDCGKEMGTLCEQGRCMK